MMPESNHDTNQDFLAKKIAVNNSKGSSNITVLSEQLLSLQKLNEEIRASRRAALNIMEDAILSKEALRASEEKYRTLFETIDDGFAIIEMIFDNTGKAVDFIYREANPALIAQTGVDITGKSRKEVFPDLDQSTLDSYGNVAKNGISVEQEYTIPGLDGQWFQATASRISEGNKKMISVVSRNITDRKLREQQQEFRLKLSDEIRHLLDPTEIEEAVTRIAMKYFRSNRCYFCLIEGENAIISRDAATEGLPSVAGSYLLSSFPLFKKVIDSGKTFVVNDAKTSKILDKELRALCLQLKVISFIDVPVIKNGKPVGILCLVQSTSRSWSNQEIELANETAELVWSAVERAKTEEALHQSEARLKATMDSATDYAIITTNPQGIIERWSFGAEKIFGYKEAEVIGKSADLIFTQENRSTNIPEHEMEVARETGSSIDERWHLRKNGSKFFASGIMSPIKGAISPIKNNELTGYVKVARDMTEQKEAEENLKIWEERYRIALQSAQMAAWDWNIPENKIAWNDQHYYLLGLQPDDKEKNAADFFQFIHPDDVEKIENAFQKAVAETGIYQADFRILRKDSGEERWMHGFGQVIRKKDGKAARMVGVMFDITERKQLEQQKDDFIVVASHELKTPVTSIKVYSEILEDICQKGEFESGGRIVKKLNRQVERLIELINALLDISKIKGGHLALNKEICDLNQLIQRRIEEMPKVPSTHKIVFSETESTMVNADCERIGQVITNLISNAIKYSPKGGKITIGWNKSEDFVTVSIQDEGIGIAEEVKKKIFERFFRVKDVQVSTYPGMGMGLFITANIVHQHGGEIWVESLPEKGSAFYFTLPLEQDRNA